MAEDTLNFSPIRMTAASEEAAVQQAMQIVGASREQVSVEIISQDAKGVTVRVSPRREGDSASRSSASASDPGSVSASAPSQTVTEDELATNDSATADELADTAEEYASSNVDSDTVEYGSEE